MTSGALPMLSYAWTAAFLRTRLPSGQQWRCLFAYRDDILVGVMPLLRQGAGRRARLRALTDQHTTVGHPLLARGQERETFEALLAATRTLEPAFTSIQFKRVERSSPTVAAVQDQPRRDKVFAPHVSHGSYVGTDGSVEPMVSLAVSGNFARNLRKALNRARRLHTLRFERIGGEQASDPQHLAEFLGLETSGWKGEAGTAIAQSSQLTRFYQELTRGLGQRGWLEWHRAHFDDTLVASHLCVRMAGALVLPKIAYDEGHARLSPGSLLFQQLLQWAHEDPEVREVNCLSDVDWHRNWNMPRREYTDLLLVRRRPIPLVLSLRDSGVPASAARAVARKAPPLAAAARRASEPFRRD